MKILNIGSINLDKSYHVEQFVTAGKTSRALDHRYESFTVEQALKRASKASSVCISRQGAALSIPRRKEVDL